MALDWVREAPAWPNAEFSRFVSAGGLRWHVQVLPAQQPTAAGALLLLHGTGASSHSWRDLAPRLRDRFTVVVPDLPGHGFSQPGGAGRSSLHGMSQALTGLLASLDLAPDCIVGHSAGAAIAAQMCLSEHCTARRMIAINGALLPLRGLAGKLFSPLAKLLSGNRVVPSLFVSLIGDHRRVERMLAATGSNIDPRGQRLYESVIRDRNHVAGALAMMAHWDLYSLEKALPELRAELHLLTGSNDRTVPASQAQRVAQLLPNAHLLSFPGLGHLAHEEQPELFAQAILAIACAAHG